MGEAYFAPPSGCGRELFEIVSLAASIVAASVAVHFEDGHELLQMQRPLIQASLELGLEGGGFKSAQVAHEGQMLSYA